MKAWWTSCDTVKKLIFSSELVRRIIYELGACTITLASTVIIEGPNAAQ